MASNVEIAPIYMGHYHEKQDHPSHIHVFKQEFRNQFYVVISAPGRTWSQMHYMHSSLFNITSSRPGRPFRIFSVCRQTVEQPLIDYG